MAEPPPGSRIVCLRPALEPALASRGRTFLCPQVRGLESGIDTDQLDVLQLLASELITNSLVYARTKPEITAHYDQRGVRLSVSDLNSRRPVPFHRHGRGEAGGRGHALLSGGFG